MKYGLSVGTFSNNGNACFFITHNSYDNSECQRELENKKKKQTETTGK